MSLIIEDGSIVANANSYATVPEIQAYALARGFNLPTTVDDVEVLALKAMDFLEGKRAYYQGSKTNPANQELQWPRTGVKIDCFDFPSDAIPKELGNAQMQLCIESYNGIDLQPTTEQGFVTEDTVGPLTTKYSEKVGTSTGPNMTAVDSLLQPLYNPCGSGFALKTVRL